MGWWERSYSGAGWGGTVTETVPKETRPQHDDEYCEWSWSAIHAVPWGILYWKHFNSVVLKGHVWVATSATQPLHQKHMLRVHIQINRGAPKRRARGARPPPLWTWKTQGFIFRVSSVKLRNLHLWSLFFMLFAMWEDWGSLQHGK